MRYFYYQFLLMIGLLLTLTAQAEPDNLYEEIKKNGVLIVATEGTYPPFSYHDKSGDLVGFDVAVIIEVAKRLSLKIDFIESRWDGLLAGLTAKRWHIVANQVWANEARQKSYTLTDPYMQSYPSIITRADNDSILSWKDLINKKAANPITSAYAQLLKHLNADIISIDSFFEAIKLIETKRADFTLNDKKAVDFFFQNQAESQFKIIEWEGVALYSIVFALRKEGSNELAQAINQALANMQEDGTIDKIYQDYFNLDSSFKSSDSFSWLINLYSDFIYAFL